MSKQAIFYMPQRSSECFRRGKSAEEFRVVRALQNWTNPLTDMCYCFECSREFALSDPNSYPQICLNASCRKKYNGLGMYTLPDVILHEDDKKAIVYVNGGVHYKDKKQKYKDRYQILRLRQNGYKIFLVRNEEIATESNLLSMTRTWVDALKDDTLYHKIMRNETEF